MRFVVLVLLLVAVGCSPRSSAPVALRADIVRSFPHVRDAYTQGLQHRDGKLWESTGMYGKSRIREIDAGTGALVREIETGRRYFGEGLTWHKDEIWVLTWREGTAFVIDPVSLEKKRTFSFEGEGWGLTSDGTHLIKSDGTSTLKFHRDSDFAVIKKMAVTEKNRPVNNLNELEYVDGQIFANVYMTDRIVRIDAGNGEITGSVELSALRPLLPQPHRAEVLNGIAFNAQTGTFYITGKYWPLIFEMRIRP